MSIRVAINGFGRIGRLVFRNMLERKGKFEIVAINDLAEPSGLAHMLKYDTVHGRYPGTVTHDESSITVDGSRIEILKERDPANTMELSRASGPTAGGTTPLRLENTTFEGPTY